MSEALLITDNIKQIIAKLNDYLGEGTGIKIPTSTTALLVDEADTINTSDLKIEGFMVFDITSNLPLWAAGDGPNDVWLDATGSTSVTPVA